MNWADQLFWQMNTIHLKPEREYRFHPERKWRFDFAFPDIKLAVEFEGGVFKKGPSGHQGAGFVKDLDKYNMAAELDWMVLRYTDKAVKSGEALNQIERVHGSR